MTINQKYKDYFNKLVPTDFSESYYAINMFWAKMFIDCLTSESGTVRKNKLVC